MTKTAAPTRRAKKPAASAAAAEAAPPAAAPAAAPEAEAQPAQAVPATPPAAPPNAPPAGDTQISFSRGLHDWLAQRKCALAFSCYQSGHLFMVGRGPKGSVNLNGQNFGRTMGLHAQPGRLFLGSLYQIWKLENALGPNERANEVHDGLYIPRTGQTIGDVDIHEVNVDKSGRVVFVNTKFSCLAVISPSRGFTPLWKPDFISRLAAEDRCHLNGLAMHEGIVRYVTAVSRSDITMGWRERRHEGGVLIDVQTNRIVTDQLSMPHSPRVRMGAVWCLDSGRGQLIRIDPATGKRENIAFVPGFARGLSFINQYAVVTLSKPRGQEAFRNLELRDEIIKRDGEPWCGIMIIDTNTGDTVEWIRAEGAITELFDVAVMPGVVSPISMAPDAPGLRTLLSYDATYAPMAV